MTKRNTHLLWFLDFGSKLGAPPAKTWMRVVPLRQQDL